MDVFLYQGEWDNKNNVRLTDPTVARGGGVVYTMPLTNIAYSPLAPGMHYGVRFVIPIVNIIYSTDRLQPVLSGIDPIRTRFRLNVIDKHISLKFENLPPHGFQLKELRFLGVPISEARPDVITLNVTDTHASLKFQNNAGADLILHFLRLLFNVVGEKEPNMIPMNVTSSHVSVKFQGAEELNFVDFLIDPKVNW